MCELLIYEYSFLEGGSGVFMTFSSGLTASKRLRTVTVGFDLHIQVTLRAFRCEAAGAEGGGLSISTWEPCLPHRLLGARRARPQSESPFHVPGNLSALFSVAKS